ncbi:hypothetical protein M0208_02630 [Sphingomonas sp. SUN019]|uniref:hypothetical protein n=1 Tax=Sphingomonas sp. SUN019 TaxID=2937788 RepID=UPI0021642FF1|nr:hypothetical protein [Sphingomonas sp. SUN019]UVO49460.1 hypothetical protein M0208_02630 [Sphingomonas sp. SUN019]
MDQLNDREYYRSRAIASRQLAERCSDPQIAKIHSDFARHYEAAMASRQPLLRAVDD